LARSRLTARSMVAAAGGEARLDVPPRARSRCQRPRDRIGDPIASLKSNFTYRRGILSDARVGRQQGYAFDDALRNQQSVERVAMQRRKIYDGNSMLARDGQLLIAVAQKIAPEQCRIDPEIGPSKPAFDGNLPH